MLSPLTKYIKIIVVVFFFLSQFFFFANLYLGNSVYKGLLGFTYTCAHVMIWFVTKKFLRTWKSYLSPFYRLKRNCMVQVKLRNPEPTLYHTYQIFFNAHLASILLCVGCKVKKSAEILVHFWAFACNANKQGWSHF